MIKQAAKIWQRWVSTWYTAVRPDVERLRRWQ